MFPQRTKTRRGRPAAAASQDQTKATRAQGVRQIHPQIEGQKTDLDIVFVPGFGAHPERSWQSEKTKFNWMKHDGGVIRDFPNARILLYMNESSWKGEHKVKQVIQNLANTLLVGLQEKRDSESTKPIIFIGHSMGGLIVAKAVCLASSRPDKFPNMFEDIRGCLVFGTPFRGAEVASLGSMVAGLGEKLDLSTQTDLMQFMKHDSGALEELRNEFGRLVRVLTPNISLIGYYEMQKTSVADALGGPSYLAMLDPLIPDKFAQFVTKESALMDGMDDDIGLTTNHRDLVKFDGSKDERYALVRGPLQKLVGDASLITRKRREVRRNTDKGSVKKLLKMLDGAQMQKIREKMGKDTAGAAWILKELERIGWLVTTDETVPPPLVAQELCVWIRGSEGRGRTGVTLATLDKLDPLSGTSEDSNVNVAYYFCGSPLDHGSAEELLQSLIRQLIEMEERLANHAIFLLDKKSKNDSGSKSLLTVENLWQVLQLMLMDPCLYEATVFLVVHNIQVLTPESDSTKKVLSLLKGEMAKLSSSKSEGGRRAMIRWLITSGEPFGEALMGEQVRLIDLEDDQYGDQVKQELQRHALKKVDALVEEKNYSKALAYFVGSLLGRKAQNTQWIDITYLQLSSLSEKESELQIRRFLEAMPIELDTLLCDAWRQVLREGKEKEHEIEEMLRVLALTYEDPSVAELALLVGMDSSPEEVKELLDLVHKCRPLVVLKRTGSSATQKVCFVNGAVRAHLLENGRKLLGLSDDHTKLLHGMLGLRAFYHIVDAVKDTDNTLNPDAQDGMEPQDVNAEEEDQAAAQENEGDEDDTSEDEDSDEDEDEEDSEDESEDEYDSDDWDGVNVDEQNEEAGQSAFDYCVIHWLHHASKATIEIAESLSQADEFWETGSKIRNRWLKRYSVLTETFTTHKKHKLPGLHVAAAVGYRKLVTCLIKNGHDSEKNLRDANSFTPLHWAAMFGRPNIVVELINQGAEVNDGMEERLRTPLHLAAVEGKASVIARLLEGKANGNATSDDYGGVINAAISSGNFDSVRLLVESGISLISDMEDDDDDDNADGKDEGDENGDDEGEGDDGEEEDEEEEDGDDDDYIIWSPLALAASHPDPSMFQFLIDNYLERFPQKEFHTALIEAAGHDRRQAFEQLLGMLLTTQPPDEETKKALQEALTEAAYKDHWVVMNTLLNKCEGLDCEEAFIFAAQRSDEEEEIEILQAMWEYAHKTISAKTLDDALYHATDYENEKMVRLLIDFGASVDATGDEFGNALTAAAYDGTVNIVTLLLDSGADINSENGWALQTAAANGHAEVVDLLLSRGADIDACTTHKNMQHGTAIMAAVEAGELDILNTLLEHGANPNLGGGENSYPIIAAVRPDAEAILERLVEAKADVNVRGGVDMTTALIDAARMLSDKEVRLLFDAGADIDQADKDGETALMLAAASNRHDCVRLLLELGANVLLTNHNGHNALDIASFRVGEDNTDKECLEILVAHVSLILAALKTSMESGNAEVSAVVRGVQARGQTLNYDEPDSAAQNDREAEHPSSMDTKESPNVPLNGVAETVTQNGSLTTISGDSNSQGYEMESSWRGSTPSSWLSYNTHNAEEGKSRQNESAPTAPILSQPINPTGSPMESPPPRHETQSPAAGSPFLKRKPVPSIPRESQGGPPGPPPVTDHFPPQTFSSPPWTAPQQPSGNIQPPGFPPPQRSDMHRASSSQFMPYRPESTYSLPLQQQPPPQPLQPPQPPHPPLPQPQQPHLMTQYPNHPPPGHGVDQNQFSQPTRQYMPYGSRPPLHPGGPPEGHFR